MSCHAVWRAIVLGMAVVAALGVAQDEDDWAAAAVYARTDFAGRVKISAYVYGAGPLERAELGALIREALKCDWRSAESEPQHAKGVCRGLLSSDGAVVDGSLRLAPLVAALHKAGAVRVSLDVTVPSGDRSPARAGGWSVTGSQGERSYAFLSQADGELPPALGIHMVRAGASSRPWRLILPLAVVLIAPASMAYWLRRRTPRAGPSPGLVWLNWITLGAWLYWLWNVNIADVATLATRLQLESVVVSWLIGAALFSIPPLVSMAGCLAVLAPSVLSDPRPPGALARLLKGGLLTQAKLIVPLGLLLAGLETGDLSPQVLIVSLLAAYIAYRGIGWWAWRCRFGEIRTVESGEFLERVRALAQKAGVEVKKVCLLRNLMPHETNAFAMSGAQVIVTEGLIRSLTRREVDAVVAHEIGHLGRRRIGARIVAAFAGVLCGGLLFWRLTFESSAPALSHSLPPTLIALALISAYFSRRHEFSADARAVELTGDPEAKIAALARIAQLRRTPLAWGGIQGSILSHPSMRNRVLAIARRFQLPEDRALAILENPDILGGEAYDVRHSLPAELEGGDPIFNLAAKLNFQVRMGWLVEASILALLVGLSSAALPLFELTLRLILHGPLAAYWRHYRLILLTPVGLALPAVFWLQLRIGRWFALHFMKQMKRRIGKRLGCEEGAMFVGLRPGDRIEVTEGFYDWDLGFLNLTEDRLVYTGERAQFSLPRSAITGLEIKKGPFAWTRAYAVVVDWVGGAFSLARADRGCPRGQARRLEAELNRWWKAGGAPVGTTSELPEPVLPEVQPDRFTRSRLLRWLGTKTVKLFVAGMLVGALMQNPAVLIVPFAAPLLYAVWAVPSFVFLWPRRKPSA
jgi:Zn-dependent protease with chaperone function